MAKFSQDEAREDAATDAAHPAPAAGRSPRRDHLSLLIDAGDLCARAADDATLLTELADLAVRDFAEWCIVDRFGPAGVAQRLAVAHRDPKGAAVAAALRTQVPLVLSGVLQQVAETVAPGRASQEIAATPETLAGGAEAARTLRGTGCTSLLVVPLRLHGTALGALTFLRVQPDDPFDAEDERVASDLGQRAAFLVEVSRLDQDAQETGHAREAERNRLQQILDVLPEGIALVDVRGQVIMSNSAARGIWGGAGWDGLTADTPTMWRLNGQPYPPSATPLRRSVQRGEEVRGEQLLIEEPETKRRVPILINSGPLRNTSGTIIGAVAVFQDITSIKDFERQKDEFLTTVSHDLKNPLTTIKSLSQLARRLAGRIEGDQAPRVTEKLVLIDQTASRATSILNEIVDIARLEMGRPLSLNEAPTDLTALVERVVEEYRTSTDHHSFRVECNDSEVIGSWDEIRLGRIIDNLISNAVKYDPAGGEVLISIERGTDPSGEWAVLRVRDEGIGIPAEERPLVFERFYRGSNVVGRIGGSGIGLAGARQIIEQHGGRITVDSEVGAGSTFTVRLPLARQ